MTPAEELWVRRRMRGETQAMAAKRLGVGRTKYAMAELAHEATPKMWLRGKAVSPDPGTRCALARRRAGLSSREAAVRFGVSHATYLKWEDRGDARVCRYWRVFPVGP